MQAEMLATDFQLKREEAIHLVNINFKIKVLFSSDNPRVLGRTFSCSAIDVTKSGIQINSLLPLAINSVLDLSVTMEDSGHEYMVTGDVKWCKFGTGVSYKIGIQLKSRPGTATDLDNWKRLIKHLK